MSKVFVTGGAGFVGSHVVRRFVDRGDQVFVYDAFQQYLLADPKAQPHNLLIRLADLLDRIEVIQGDTQCREHLRRVLGRIEPTVIVHMAALPLVSAALENTETAFGSILTSSVNLLEIMRDFTHPSRLVYTSSSMVYGDFRTDRVAEDEPTRPKDVYGSLKLCGEIMVRGYARSFGLDVAIVRPTAVYGPYDANERVIQRFIRRALRGEPLRIDGDGSLMLDFTFVEDTADGIFLAATHPSASGETFNVARGCAQSLRSVVEVIKRCIPDVSVEHGPVPSHVPRRGTLDVSKARTMLGYDPKHDVETAVPRYIDHLMTHPI